MVFIKEISTNNKVAIKIIDKNKITNQYSYSLIQNEIKAMRHLDSINIVKFHDVLIT
jgi:serine/threonine protein kinase